MGKKQLDQLCVSDVNLISFIPLLFKRFWFLIIKMVGSRTSFFHLLFNLYCGHMIYNLDDGWQRVAVLIINVIGNAIYFRYIRFNNVNTNINVGIQR